MIETVYRTARPEERADMVDLANYVFSQAHVPHDFKTLLPKTYADDAPDFSDWHYTAWQGNKIVSLIACRPEVMHFAEESLKCGLVGTVCVHYCHRSEGHMKKLMPMMIEASREKGYDLLVLGGQRQRYNYFGFDKAGIVMNYRITRTNLRHCLSDLDTSCIELSPLTIEKPDEVDFARKLAMQQTVHSGRGETREDFIRYMHSWNLDCDIIRINGELAGYAYGAGCEIGLLNDEYYLAVVKKLFERYNEDHITIRLSPEDRERCAKLETLCEGFDIGCCEMVNVLNWKNVLQALLTYKARYTVLTEGKKGYLIEGKPYCISVKDNKVTVTEEETENAVVMDHMQATRYFFPLSKLAVNDDGNNWAPLPYYMTSADTF